jgi:hypothetical protein
MAAGYRHYQHVLSRFQEYHGKITNLYYCSHIKAGAARTDKDMDDIFLSCHAINASLDPRHVSQISTSGDLDPAIELLLFKCKLLHTKTIRLLSGDDRRQCAAMCYSIIVHLLNLADHIQGAASAHGAGKSAKVLAFLRRELDRAERYQAEAAERRAQLRYMKGMVLGAAGLLALGLVLLLVGIALPEVMHDQLNFINAQFSPSNTAGTNAVAALIASFTAGALGAVVSVMARISARKCILDSDAGETILVRLGAFRPLIGALFGGIAFSMIAGGVLPIRPNNTDGNIYFYATLAFFAGFSERFAQDMLALGQSRIAAQTPDPDQPDHADAPAATPGTVHPHRLRTKARVRGTVDSAAAGGVLPEAGEELVRS